MTITVLQFTMLNQYRLPKGPHKILLRSAMLSAELAT